MPFESDKQRKYLWSQKPEVARQLAYHNMGGPIGFRPAPQQPTAYQPVQPYGTPYRAPTPPRPAPAPLTPTMTPVAPRREMNFADHGGPDGGANSQGNEGGGGGGGGGGK